MKSKFLPAAVPVDPHMSESKNSSNFSYWGTARLRFMFLTPLVIITIIIVLLLSALLYQQVRKDLQHGMVRIHTSAKNFYEESIRNDTQMLLGMMHLLEHDTRLRSALSRRDSPALLQHAGPYFEQLKSDFNITHFYFNDPERVNLLRVHAPLRFGDVIDHTTTLQAEKTGKIAYGVELGSLGTFTLRLVSPWYDEQSHKLIGYVELGMETDQVLNKLENFFGLQLITTVYKKFLQRDRWEAGMRALGRTPHWDRFPNMVASERSSDTIPPLMIKHLSRDPIATNVTSMEITDKEFTYHMIHVPLFDAAGREMAQMILLANVSQEVKKIRETMYVGSFAMFVAALFLFTIFYWLLGKIGRRIKNDEQILQNLAIRDGLTGLYNHRTFYTLIEEELKRILRHERPLALLMLDIDHFKRVNDTYGHQAGDLVLRELSELLMQQAREIDHVCRYGGEEMIIVLPETDTEMAIIIAERIRKTVEAHVFNISDDKHLSITISIGVASYPLHADTKEALITAADNAMYQAKQSGRNRVCIYSGTAA